MPDKEQSTITYPADAYQAVVAETHRLRAENERLRADKLLLCTCPTEIHYEDCQAIGNWGEVEALRAENERLGAALADAEHRLEVITKLWHEASGGGPNV